MVFIYSDEALVVEATQIQNALSESGVPSWISPTQRKDDRNAFVDAGFWVVLSRDRRSEQDIDEIAASYHKVHRPIFLGQVLPGPPELGALTLDDPTGTAGRLIARMGSHELARTVDEEFRGLKSTMLATWFSNNLFVGQDIVGIGLGELPSRVEVFHWTKAPAGVLVSEDTGQKSVVLKPFDPKHDFGPRTNLSLVEMAHLARLDLETGSFAQVLEYCDLLRKRAPRWMMGWFLEGLAAMKQGETIRARFYMNAARALAPNSFLVAYYRAVSDDRVDELQEILRSSDLVRNCIACALTELPANDPYARVLREGPETRDAFRDFCRDLAVADPDQIETRTDAQPGSAKLPLFLHGFGLRKFQRFERAEAEDLCPNSPWIFLTGDNGEGKTSLLQGLGIALRGTDSSITVHGASAKVYVCLARENGTIVTGEVSHKLGARIYGTCPVIGYGAIRQNIGPSNEEPTSFLDGSMDSLLGSGKALLDIEEHLIRLQSRVNALALDLHKQGAESNLDEKQRLIGRDVDTVDRIEQVLIALLPKVEAIEVSFEGEKSEVLYREKDRLVSNHQLSAGHRAIVSLIGDMIIRLTAYQKDKPFAEMEGLVLIDELENHLHARWQYALPRKMSEIFPRVQFIVSTHSPIPLLGAPPGSLVWRIDHNDENESVIIPLEIDLSRLHPSNLLSSPAFGFDGFLDHADMENLATTADFSEIAKSEKLDDYLRWAETHVSIPDDFFDKP